jgi:phospholipid transport system substrate-binding protein
MLEMVQNTIETSAEKASDGLVRPSLLHECESAVKPVVSIAYWRIASAEQRQEFEKLFEDYLIRSDGPLLVQHSGGTFRVTGSRTNPAGVIVTSQITSTQGQPIEMDWQLGISDGRYKIQDVSIDGVSAAMTRRSQMEAMMSRAGGQVATLLAMMRQEG